jgi:hypothetical protein
VLIIKPKSEKVIYVEAEIRILSKQNNEIIKDFKLSFTQGPWSLVLGPYPFSHTWLTFVPEDRGSRSSAASINCHQIVIIISINLY